MGDFNHKGNFSNLPIEYGDEIVVLVGLARNNKNYDIDNFAPGMSFVPMSLPIYGRYDDYGGIENVIKTSGIEQLEKTFGDTAENIVSWAERVSADCSDQLGFSINDKLKEIIEKNHISFFRETIDDMRFGYIMEHKSVFETLVRIGNPLVKEQRFWRIPHDMILSLGYEKELIGEDRSYEKILWKHKTLPMLKECCYVWLKDEFNDYSKVSHNFSELCKKIGCEVPEEYNYGYFERCFDKSIKYKNIEDDIDRYIAINKAGGHENYSYLPHPMTSGLFSYNNYYYTDGLCGIFNVEKCEHLDEKYKKEFSELSGLLNAMSILQITWGTTNYYSQTVSYDRVEEFQESILSVIKEKIQKNKEEDEEE